MKECSTAVTFDSYRNYKSVCEVCGQDLKQNKLLAKHIIGHIREISNTAQGIDGEIISKSIPSADRNEDPSNNSEDYIWTSIYGDENNSIRKHVVSYNGIDNDILMASCLFPYSNHHTRLYDLVSREQRTFWDGAFLSNTPLRELLQKHKDFWTRYFKANDIKYDNIGEHESRIYQDQSLGRSSGIPKIPDLEVFIINLYPVMRPRMIPSQKIETKLKIE